MMDIDQLQSVRDRERGTDDLQELRESFYADATAFIEDLRAERAEAAEAVDDPFDSPRVTRLTDRIRTAERTLEAIYEKRVGKVVKAATFAAADLPAEADGMTAEEADLFETLVAEIQANREEVLGGVGDEDELDDTAGVDAAGSEGTDVEAADVMGADAGPEPTPPEPPDGPPADESESTGEESDEPSAPDESAAEDVEGGEAASAAAPDSEPARDVERERIRITDDVGAILGVDDREYDLAAGEVVTLPSANAKPLIEQGVAERLE